MHRQSVGALLALVLVSIGSLPQSLASSDVLVLTPENIDSVLQEHPVLLVEFYAPWCGHCKRLAPEYDRAAASLAQEVPPLRIAKVDCDAHKELGSRYGISGFPTLKLFRDGSFSEDYKGERTASSIVKYVKSRAGPAIKKLSESSDLDKLLEGRSTVVVGVFSSEHSALAKAFFSAAAALRDNVVFAHAVSPSVLSSLSIDGASSSDGVHAVLPKIYASKYESRVVSYSGDPEIDNLVNWAKQNSLPLVGQIDAENNAQYLQTAGTDKFLVVVYYDVDYHRNSKMTNYWRNRILPIAAQWKDKNVMFAIGNKDDYAGLLKEVMPSDVEISVIAWKGGKMYLMNGPFKPEALASFVQELADSKIQPHVKSQPVPAPSKPGEVVVVVGQTFDELVTLSNKHVLIEFYATWCGHCKKLEPIYNELAKKLTHDDRIVVAKIEATENDFPREKFEVSGFPTIYFINKDTGQPVIYQGQRDVDSFLTFLRQEIGSVQLEADGNKQEL